MAGVLYYPLPIKSLSANLILILFSTLEKDGIQSQLVVFEY